jgi:hypothetical protein
MTTYVVSAEAVLMDGQRALKFFTGPSPMLAMRSAEAWGKGLFARGEATQVVYAPEKKGEK